MSLETGHLLLPYREENDPVTPDLGTQDLAERLAEVVQLYGTYALRPPVAGDFTGAVYFATDKAMTFQSIAGAWVLINAYAPRVTALPANPIDGQECKFDWTPDAGFWHLRYQSSSAKWHFVGGPPLAATAGGAAGDPVAGTGYGALAGGPSITVPLPGRYIIEQAYQGKPEGTVGTLHGSVAIGAVAASDDDAISYSSGNTPADNPMIWVGPRPLVKDIATAATVVAAQFRRTSSSAQVARRTLKITPQYLTA